jgi:hypothetical protein
VTACDMEALLRAEAPQVFEFYAVRRVRDKYYSPDTAENGNPSRTWAEPMDPRHERPRLFRREQDAKTALTYWLKGRLREIPCQASHESFGNDDVRMELEPVPGRVRDDYEVVAVYMELPA